LFDSGPGQPKGLGKSSHGHAHLSVHVIELVADVDCVHWLLSVISHYLKYKLPLIWWLDDTWNFFQTDFRGGKPALVPTRHVITVAVLSDRDRMREVESVFLHSFDQPRYLMRVWWSINRVRV